MKTRVTDTIKDTLFEFTMTYLLEHPQNVGVHAKRFFTRLQKSRLTSREYDLVAPGAIEAESFSSSSGPPRRGERRGVVYGESYDPKEDEDFVKPVYSKTDEERETLEEVAKRTLLFRALDDEQLEDIINAMFKRLTRPGDVIIKQGDDGDNFYVIERGIFDCFMAKPGEEPELIFSYEHSGNFGELALLYNQPRAATVIAVTRGVIWALDRRTFRKLVMQSAHEKRELYQKFTRTVPILKRLGSYEKLNIADVLVPKNFKKGERIIAQHDDADGMFFVQKGRVSIKMKDRLGRELELEKVEAGGYFGHMSLITKRPRHISAYAESDTRLAFLDEEAFERFMGPCMSELKKNVDTYKQKVMELFGEADLSLDQSASSSESLPTSRPPQRRGVVYGESYDPNADREEFVKPVYPKTEEELEVLHEVAKRTIIFHALDEEQLEDVINAMFKRETQPGDVIIEQGEAGDNFYVIEKGLFDVFMAKPGESREHIFSYEDSGNFGELALLYNQPRAATVIAATEGVIWALDRKTFRKLVMQSVHEKREVYERFIKTIPILDALGSYERLNLADVLVPKRFKKGEYILRQGETAEGMYFIENGVVSVRKRNRFGKEIELERQDAGGYFGELAMVTGKPRHASAYAETDTSLAFLDAEAFERFLGPCMDIFRQDVDHYKEKVRGFLGTDYMSSEESSSSESIHVARNTQRRGVVYGESYDPNADKEEFVKPVHSKTDSERATLHDVAKRTLLFQALQDEQLEDVINAMFKRETKPGDDIIQQGEDGDNFYVIEKGVFDVFMQQPGEERKHIFSYEDSGCFGELALLYNQPRGATVIAATEGVIWALDRETFRKLVMQTANERREKYEQFIKTVPMLEQLGSYERLNLADVFMTKKFIKGELIIRQGDEPDGMYFVEDGVVSVKKKNRFGNEIELKKVEPGGYFGELALVTKRPRHASAYAETSIRVAFLDTDAFERFMGPCMDVMKRNVEHYKQQVKVLFGPENLPSSESSSSESVPLARPARRGVVFGESYDPNKDKDDFVKPVHPKSDEEVNTLHDVAKKTLLFQALDEEQLEDVINAMFKKETQPGDVIIEQGEAGDNFYVIEKGTYDVFMAKPGEDRKHIFSYENSGNFGELSLLYNQPRAATVISKTPGVIWALDRMTFRKLVMHSAHQKRETYEQFIKTVPMLQPLGSYERMNLADVLVPKRYKPDDLVIKEGDKADGMYFIENGTVSVWISNTEGEKVLLQEIGSGGYFGELALITNRPRKATVYSKTETRLAFLDTAAFERFMGPCMELMKTHIENYETQIEHFLKCTSTIKI